MTDMNRRGFLAGLFAIPAAGALEVLPKGSVKASIEHDAMHMPHKVMAEIDEALVLDSHAQKHVLATMAESFGRAFGQERDRRAVRVLK